MIFHGIDFSGGDNPAGKIWVATRDGGKPVALRRGFDIFKEARGVDIPTPFPRLTYADAMSRFGSDKPDTRFGLELVEIADIFRDSQFKVFRSIAEGGSTCSEPSPSSSTLPRNSGRSTR